MFAFFAHSNVCNCKDCENHDRESDYEDTSDSEIMFSDADSDGSEFNNPNILQETFT